MTPGNSFWRVPIGKEPPLNKNLVFEEAPSSLKGLQAANFAVSHNFDIHQRIRAHPEQKIGPSQGGNKA